MSTARIDASLRSALGDEPLDLGDVETVRLILQGDSIIDWNRAHFRSLADVDRFLGLHLLDLSRDEDVARLEFVYAEAINYLEEHVGLRFPPDMKNPDDVREIFLLASQTGGFRRRQILACVILKLMHVINHMEAAELRFQTPLSEAEVLDLAERRIVRAAARMRAEGFPIVSFYGSRKTRSSVITKLLAKKDTTAATIFDKLRFRIVTEDREHVLPAIRWLTRNLFPFNYVIPGQSHNNLLPLGRMLREPPFSAFLDQLQGGPPAPDNGLLPEDNPFSGSTYRMINFIVDFPVRVDHQVDPRTAVLLGRTVFALVEFQVVDERTADENERGDNAHDRYKERQRAIVERRLRKGARWRRKLQGS